MTASTTHDRGPHSAKPWVLATIVLALALVGGGVGVAVSWPRSSRSPSTSPTRSTTLPTPAVGSALACSPSSTATPAPGTPVTFAATLGTVSATITGTEGAEDFNQYLTNPMINIRSGHSTLVNAVLQVPATAQGVQLSGLGAATSGQNICVARFPGENTPAVLVAFFTGGAHCCSVLRAWSATQGAVPHDENVGNGGVEATTSLTGAEIITTDNDFYYSFTDYAASAAPVLVQTFRDARFVDVTDQHRDLVQADATALFDLYEGAQTPGAMSTNYVNGEGGLGDLAAWAGDECRLDVTGEPWSTLDSLQTMGQLTGPPGTSPTGQTFIDQLRTFLSRHGFCTDH